MRPYGRERRSDPPAGCYNSPAGEIFSQALSFASAASAASDTTLSHQQKIQTALKNAGVYNGAIDGFTIEGGDQLGFPTNVNQIGGGNTVSAVITHDSAIRLELKVGGHACATGLLAAEMAARGTKGTAETVGIWLPVISEQNHPERLVEGIGSA